MSKESSTAGKRPYRKRRRAKLEEETRLRITKAAIDLHGSVGPARTTISAVADRAGVQRATIYRHFGDEQALFAACSSHWMAQHPLPDTRRRRIGAAVRHALSFEIWRSLVREQGLTASQAIDLMAGLVTVAARR